MGPNGAGKSTTLKMITGMLHPTSGEILFENHPWSRKDLADIGALIESPPLYENLTAKENLKVRTLLFGLPDSRINEVLETVDLTDTKIQDMRSLIRSFPQQGITVILSSHILSEVELIADHIGIISNGVLGYEAKINPGEDLESLFMEVVKNSKKVGA